MEDPAQEQPEAATPSKKINVAIWALTSEKPHRVFYTDYLVINTDDGTIFQGITLIVRRELSRLLGLWDLSIRVLGVLDKGGDNFSSLEWCKYLIPSSGKRSVRRDGPSWCLNS